MPLAPRLQRKSASASAGGQEGLLVADRHARGGVDEVAVAVGARRAPRAGPARSGSSSSAELGLDRLARRGLGLDPHRRRLGRSSPSRAAHPAASSVGSARSSAAARRVGSFQPPSGSTTIWSAPRLAPARPAAACWSASPRSGGRGRATSGSAEPLVAQQQVVGGDDVRAVVRAAADLRGRLGEDRDSRRRGRGRRAARAAPGRAGARRRSRRASASPMCLATSSSRNSRGLHVDRGHRGQRPRVAALAARAGRSPSPRPRPASGASGSRQGEVEVDRARAAAHRAPRRTRGRRSSGSGAARRRRRRGSRLRRTSAPRTP